MSWVNGQKPWKAVWNMQQATARNASVIAAFVYSHSGEFGTVSHDVRLPGRGLDLEFVRNYRSSLAGSIGELGRGWSCNLAKRLDRVGQDIVYRDGTGVAHCFARTENGGYAAPPGVYALLHEAEGRMVMQHRFGKVSTFGLPDE